MERCPVCRARLKDAGSFCRRCNSDLSLLLTIDDQAKALVGQAVAALCRGNNEAAGLLTARSLFLQNNLFARQLGRFIAAGAGGQGIERLDSAEAICCQHFST